MKLSSLFALALAALLLGACASRVDTGSVEPIAIDRSSALAAVNAFRAENGLKPLRIDERLMRAAAQQSAAMVSRDKMDHAVAGALPGRVERAGYHWGTTAENIGRGYRDYAAAMIGWIESPGHRRNLLNADVTEIGFAGARSVKGGRNYWTQIFAAPSQRAEAATAQRPFRFGPQLRFP